MDPKTIMSALICTDQLVDIEEMINQLKAAGLKNIAHKNTIFFGRCFYSCIDDVRRLKHIKNSSFRVSVSQEIQS